MQEATAAHLPQEAATENGSSCGAPLAARLEALHCGMGGFDGVFDIAG